VGLGVDGVGIMEFCIGYRIKYYSSPGLSRPHRFPGNVENPAGI